MDLKLFDYYLPKELIAQKPTLPRDQCRLLVLDRKSGQLEHRRFFEIIDYLKKGDVLVLNDSKVFKARLFGRIMNFELGIRIEIFLLRALNKDKVWEALGNPGRKLKPGVKVLFSQEVWCEVVEQRDGKYLVRFNISNSELMKWVARHGHVPVPPYIGREPKRAEEYQTVYAKHLGSVAAPTAGFHFTKLLLNKLRRKGVEIHYITLHIGYGTFQPIKTERVEEHKMEAEWVEISKSTTEAIARAKKEGRRVIAVGTTTVRALEGVAYSCHREESRQGGATWRSSTSTGLLLRQLADHNDGFGGEVNIFITPGFKFQIVDALVTNFHLPKSTLLLLVSAFANHNLIMKAYGEAVEKKYKFYSFGDAMLVL